MTDEPQIYCPQCRYRPQAEDRWWCVPSCGTVWHISGPAAFVPAAPTHGATLNARPAR